MVEIRDWVTLRGELRLEGGRRMGKGNRVISRLLQRGLALIAAFGVSLALAGIAAGQVATDETPGGGDGGQGEAPSLPEGQTPSDGQEEDGTLPADGQRARADLSISFPDAEKEAELRRDVRYTFRVVNRGPGTATDVRALLNPAHTFSTDDAPDSCNYSRVYRAYECVVDELPPGGEAALTVRGEFDEPGFASHTASVRSETDDPDPANNLALQRVEIEDDGEGGDDDGSVTSEFEAGTEGWTASGDPAAKPKWSSSKGEPGGFTRVVDGVRGDTLYQEAPAKFEGDKAAYYGGELSFDLRQSDRDVQFEEDDVILEGGGTTLVYDMKDEPGTRWTDFAVKLSEGRWEVSSSGKRASEQQLRDVLSDLDRLAIRAEHRNGADTDDLDNVLLEAEDDDGDDEASDEDDEASDGDDEASDGDDQASDGSKEESDESPGQPGSTSSSPR